MLFLREIHCVGKTNIWWGMLPDVTPGQAAISVQNLTLDVLWDFVGFQWPRWRLTSPASRLFTQSFIQVQIKKTIKVPRH